MTIGIPKPHLNERPADYAERIQQWYNSWHRTDKSLGQFFTPVAVARFMAGQIPLQADVLRVLDPGAGFGVLICAYCEAVTSDLEVTVYEVDEDLIPYLDACLRYAQSWMHTQGRSLRYTIHAEDFIQACGGVLSQSALNRFDVVIANPPYFKLPKTDPRVQQVASIVHGQPNMYALFMAVSAALLRPGGYAAFITPRSYAAGSYFKRFRDYFFNRMRPRMLHVFESRRDVFMNVLQESLILVAEHSTQEAPVRISTSSNLDFTPLHSRVRPLTDILDEDYVLHVPLSDDDDHIAALIRSWPNHLADYGMAISTGPVVPFRATAWVSGNGAVPGTHAPLLWMHNVKPMWCGWPVPHKAQYLRIAGADHLLLPNQNMVLLRRFSAKEESQRLVAAPYLAELAGPVIGLENHLNYIYRPDGVLTPEETRGLALLLNSSLLDSYFRIFSGNTQVSATELRRLPLPSLESITELGRLSLIHESDVDTLVTQVLGLYA
jgi:adenine-specific DNA-methyltransferase